MELSVETPYWCPSEGHKCGDRKSTKTSGIHLCCKKRSIRLLELVNIHINASPNVLTIFLNIRDNLSGGHHYLFWMEVESGKVGLYKKVI